MTAEDLRKSILQQAIQGKLVPQDPNDEPASELLSKIRSEKERLIKEKKIKRDKNETIIYRGEDNSYYEKILATGEVKCIDDEIPFEIPDSWEWCRLGNVINLLSGRDLQPNEYNSKGNGIPYMTGASNFENGKLIINRWTMKPVTISSLGDILITCKGTIGEIAINDIGEIHIARQIMAISSKIVYMPYLKLYIASLISMLKAKAKSIIPGISRDNLLNALISIPPIYEQQKIARKYIVIQPYIEAYNVAEMQTKEIETNILQNLYFSILQYAIQGRLVKQEESDGTAFDLLEQIQKEKAELVTKGKLKKSELKYSVIFRGDDNKYWEKKDNELTCIDDEIPFDIPDSWQWVRLGNFVTVIGGYAFKSSDLRSPNGYRVIRISDISESGLINKNIVRYGGGLELNQYKLRQYDILLAMTGGTVGKSLLLDMPLKEVLYLNQRVAAIRCEWLYYGYIDLFLKSSYIKSIIDKRKNSTNDNISMNDINNFLMPLPPLNEQHRICNRYKEITSIGRRKIMN